MEGGVGGLRVTRLPRHMPGDFLQAGWVGTSQGMRDLVTVELRTSGG